MFNFVTIVLNIQVSVCATGSKKSIYLFLTANKTWKTWFHKKKLCFEWFTNLGLLENLVKTWGHLKIIFLLSANTPPESKAIFANISVKSRPNSRNFYGVNLGSKGTLWWKNLI